MSDIPRELRRLSMLPPDRNHLSRVAADAADEIERLRAAICELFIYRVATKEHAHFLHERVTPKPMSQVSPPAEETIWAVLRRAQQETA